ncbi:response regulator [Thauera sp.]|uniref:response regulator n=1 Tax=Thauera sp. TaxID=1905334 RepID=UPI002A365EBA|nr:response regulator [Thauera sp.]MDX9886465.1 response regulator [Thauera sp.]
MEAIGRVLVVDDDPDVRTMLSEYLSTHGLEVATADCGAAMLEALARAVPDVVLLDLRLPGEDGLTLLRYLRQRHAVGVLIVTGVGEVVDRVVGLEMGADDYIAKPFEPRELLARIKSVLRRMVPLAAGAAGAETATPSSAGFARNEAMVAVGECRLDLRAHRLFDAAGEELMLTAMEFELLKAFVERPNQVLSRDQLLTLTRNREWEPFDRSIDIRIARLRRKVEPDPERPRLIRTVRSAGYMYVPA